MLERVVRTINRYSMFQPGHRVGVAVSGGPDSLCLLHILRELPPQWDLDLAVLHLNHKLRGKESDQDAEFVRELAGALGLPFHAGETDLSALLGTAGENLEQAARVARLDFFRGFLSSGAFDRIALGHTRSDQAETVLFRFLRGSGTAGLAGIRPITEIGFVRPLIEIERPEIEQYLRERGIPWREDSSNQSKAFARNRIRHDLLPQLTRDWNPAITETLAHTADWAQAEESYWGDELARLAPAHLVVEPPAVLLRVDSLAALPLAVGRRLVRRALELAKGDLRGIGFEHLAGVLDLASSREGHGRLQIPGLDVFRSFEWLRIAPPAADNLEQRNYRLPLPVPGSVRLPGRNSFIHVEVAENAMQTGTLQNGYNECVACLDSDRVRGCLEVRNWRPGDQYQPVGQAAAEKIKMMFQQARVPLWERRHWPIVTSGEAILWARRFGPAAEFVAGPGTRAVLSIRETGS
jgi:tRNA(Ile)-lysidine synthase